MTNFPNVALVGRMGVGKTSIAQELEALYGYKRFSWAAPVKTIAGAAYGEIVKDRPYEVSVDGHNAIRTGREILQRLGTDAMRNQVDENFWIKIGLRILEDEKHHLVNDDTRFPNEAEVLSRRGWIIVRVELSEVDRLQRLRLIYGKDMNADLLNHASETEIEKIGFNYRLWNTADPTSVARALISTLANGAVA